MARKDALGFELDKNDFVKLTKSNATLAQNKVDASASNSTDKKAAKTRKTLSAIREDDFSKNDLYQLMQKNATGNFANGFLDVIKTINDTNSTRLSDREQKCFSNYIAANKRSVLMRIKQGDLAIVNDLAKEGMRANNRYNFSFASKFCTYISRYHFGENDKFMPYDNVLQNVLPYYAWVYCRKPEVPNFKQTEDYEGYIALVRKIIEQSQILYGLKEKLSLKEFDRLLWYKYKGLLGEDLIGSDAALVRGDSMENVTVFSHPLIQHKISLLRNKETSSNEFRRLVEEIAMLEGFEALADLPLKDKEIETPIEKCVTPVLAGRKLAIVPILRAGLGMVSGVQALVPSARVGHIGLYRDETTHEPVEYCCKLPNALEERQIVVVDPMLATGGSASDAIAMIKKRGGKRIKFMCIIAAPEGLKRLHETHPDVQIYVGHLDRCLNDAAYICPGLGDAGDRIFGTK